MNGEVPVELLGPAIEAARRALRDIDEDDIPASLKRVAASSARRLPPPLARSLVRRLDELEWLREKAIEAWPDVDESSPDEAASLAFLRRGPGWQQVVEAGVAVARSEDLRREVEQLRREAEELRGRLAIETERTRHAKAEADAAQALAADRSRRLRDAVRSARSEERRRGAEVRSSRERLAGRVADLETQLAEADLRLDIAKRDLLRTRRASEAPAPTTSTADVWTARDPVDFARLLDDVARAATPAVVEAETAADRSTTWELPAGVRPDSAEAVRWLLDREEPYTVLIDGYNVARQPAEPLARDQVNLMAARWKRLAAAPVRMVVVYDSRIEREARTGSGPGGVEVRFTAQGQSADAEIVDLAGATAGPVVVVTSDRQVREDAAATLSLWSEALLDWMRRS